MAVQLVVTKLSVDPAENFDSLGNLDCALGQLTTEEIVLDIFNPNFLNPNFFNPNFFNPNFFNPNFFNPNFLNTVLDPGTANASFALSPGEVARISLRVLHNLDPSLIAGAITGDVASHAGNTLAPFAVTSGAATAEDTPVIIDFLVNVTDPDGDPVEFVGASALNGSAALNVFGQLVYTPNLHFNGTDTLVYTVSDDNGDGTSDGTADGLVVIDVTPVNDDPTAVDDPGVVVEAGSVGNLIAVLNNDSDAPDSGETLTVIATSAGSAGGVALPAAGGVTYTPVSSYAGPETFTYTIDDNNGGSAVATVTVDVVDTAPPEIGTNPNLLLKATGSDGATAIYDLPIASDAVGIASVTCVAPSGSVFPLGASDVICTATDLSGLSSESTFTVTVEDTIVPAVVAPLSITVEAEGVLTSATTAAIAAFLTSATAADVVDGDLTGAVNHNAPADFGLGATLITFSATDAAGNTGATGATVTVEDTTLPAVVAPLSIAVEAEGVLTSATTAAIAAFLTSATAADVVDGDLTGAVNHNAPADFGLGATLVTFSATDAAGNTGAADATVTVEDTTLPAVVAPLSITVEAEGVLTSATTAAIAAFLTSATAADVVDGDLTGAVNHNAPADFGLGATLVTFSATDAAGNTGAADATVTVEDTTLPAVVAPLSITVEAEGVLTSATTAAIAAFLTSATAVDVVDGDLTGAVNHNAPADFGLGATLVTFSATDAAGNTGAADATVTVVDTTPPDVDALPNVAVDADSPDGTVVNFVLPAANDIVDPAVVAACVPASGSLFSLGETTVTCSATDASGNTGESNFTVTIIDPTPPVVIVSVSPENLWPPNGDMVPITVTGSAVDSDSGVDQVTYEVIDEYGLLDQPSTLVLLDGNGNFVPFTVFLEASRRGNDQDGRTYIIRVTAESGGGSAFSFDQNVNVHDQGPDQ